MNTDFMKTIIKLNFFALFALFALFAVNAGADLTAHVAPGYTFGANERADTAKLNRLGLPTITISGTLDGTNAGISAGSINANMFSASVVDNVTLDFTNSSPQAIRIKAEGVGPREVRAAVAGAGLAGGAGTALSVTVDGTSITITNDVLSLSTNLSPHFLRIPSGSIAIGGPDGSGTNVTLAVFSSYIQTNATYTSSDLTVSAAATANNAHNLGFRPSYVRLVWVCAETDAGYSVGDEIDALCVQASSGGTLFSYGANATHVFFATVSSIPSVFTYHKSTGAVTFITLSKWRVRIYARV